ncbi:hypothetical protein B0H16DRAFT_1475122 [Mycena metata]|uniref:Uncharacterized protein n=1 Tax=Mycena metata TaxID=1033252 RepID=A0AAD7HET2_9AGAR|nr:hypothetical protein B0H16DRAFT_1475122 [Mycena metata]
MVGSVVGSGWSSTAPPHHIEHPRQHRVMEFHIERDARQQQRGVGPKGKKRDGKSREQGGKNEDCAPPEQNTGGHWEAAGLCSLPELWRSDTKKRTETPAKREGTPAKKVPAATDETLQWECTHRLNSRRESFNLENCLMQCTRKGARAFPARGATRGWFGMRKWSGKGQAKKNTHTFWNPPSHCPRHAYVHPRFDANVEVPDGRESPASQTYLSSANCEGKEHTFLQPTHTASEPDDTQPLVGDLGSSWGKAAPLWACIRVDVYQEALLTMEPGKQV